jgi:dipeptidyl aminopeptidase/acylaminoacyl peptidase
MKLAIAFLGFSAFAADVFTTSDLWNLRTVSNPLITPNGKRVIYTMTWADPMTDSFYTNLWIVGADGKDARPLTSGKFKDTSPKLSPDGARVAFVSNRAGKPQIHLLWLDTLQHAAITNLDQAPANLSWSPDSSSIAYTARVPAKPAWSVPMPQKPAGAQWSDPPIVVTRLRWKADAQGITPPGHTHIFVVPASGGASRQVTTGDFDHGGGEPQWMPDGKSILFSASRIEDADYDLQGGEIYRVSLSDGTVAQLSDRKGPDASPVASPDGKRIAFSGFDYKAQSYTVAGLSVMDADGKNVRHLTGKLDRDVRSITWAPDGSKIYFLADNRGGSQLYSATLDGVVEPLTSPQQRLGSAYAAAAPLTMSANGMIAVTSTSPLAPTDIVVFPASDPSRRTQVTFANDSLIQARKAGLVEEIEYPSFDGRKIQGWIIKPPDFNTSKKYPLLLDIHGGPHAMYGVEFNHEFQVQAARGFVVLFTNPRGSTGYGEEFGNIIHTKYPGDDYKDLMAGVDFVVAKGYIDPKRLTVTGGSGGGLLTAWIIGQTDRFAAAVSQYPVTNWFTQVGTADGGYVHGALWLSSLPWENPSLYLKQSPIFYAKNFRTPTMVLCGEEDLRTPIAESEELYFALKARKVPAVLVRIPKEPHGIRGAFPSHRIAKMEHILGWLEKWTSGPSTP